MVYVGKAALALWALGMAWVGFKLVSGTLPVVLGALEAGRLSEALMQATFISLVTAGTLAVVALFFYYAAYRE